MSTPTAIPVPFVHLEAITKETLDEVGSKSSYVKMRNGALALVMLPTGDALAVPSAYEKPLHVLSYRFELQKYTIPRVRESKRACKALLHVLLYLDRVRDRFIREVRAVPGSALQNWRCLAFEYHLWLDYMYGRHDDEARKLLESEHGVTPASITLKKSGSDILKICECTLSTCRILKYHRLLQWTGGCTNSVSVRRLTSAGLNTLWRPQSEVGNLPQQCYGPSSF